MLKGGRAAAAQPGAGREGVKKGEASRWQSRCSGWRGVAMGTRHGVMLGLGDQGTGARLGPYPGLGAGGTGLAAGLQVQCHPEMAAVGGDMDMVPTHGPAGGVAVQCLDMLSHLG